MIDLRPKPPSQIERMQRSLKDHLAQIKRLLLDPNRDTTNAHIFLAGSLRVLLCDAKPILINYAEHFGVTIKIWGPNPPNFKPDERNILVLNFTMASSSKNDVLYEMTIKEYLHTPLGIANWTPYTPYQLIKWVANKEGAAHLDPIAHNTLEDIKNTFVVGVQIPGFAATDGYMVRSAILQISEWVVEVIENILAISNQATIKPDDNKLHSSI